jgi:hypothetical protein
MELLRFEEAKLTASSKDGLSPDLESQFRNEGLVLVRDLAMELRVAQAGLATGQVLFHTVRLR